ncbi:MurR/RpiR family transcriptional regulator [Marinobacterium sediminicola]|uniref:Transcriptional regulator, RpiR family n=1 Tax=Marinobacterium sediminicola TaxID=518898 RepID=A0ABY1S1P6_9GAMM|nr:MurR/RpiR family transcriptional regulator [Marinobacterium sediminicola]ULG69775.1 MurR/RpiR family transcriptional regulator [Marinobacterium sediminicola]SMR75414.1 transcriptional regulator, RpiR family [Marinobacterium sediminicola]
MKSASGINFPPASLAELRKLPSLLKRGELTLPMGKRLLVALCVMLDDPRLVATHSITELAQVTSVSPASLTRLAKLLGFKGFVQFQSLFRHALSQPGRYYSAQASALIKPSEEMSVENRVRHHLEQQAENLAQSAAQLTEQNLSQAAQLLVKARRVRISGRRQSYGLASMFSYMLGLIREQVSVVGSAGEGQAQALAELGSRDLLVMFGSEPYSRDSVMLAQVANQLKLPLLTITDSHHSPLAQLADCSLISRNNSPLYTNSMVATQFLAETLLLQTARMLGERAVERLSHREELINRLNDEF